MPFLTPSIRYRSDNMLKSYDPSELLRVLELENALKTGRPLLQQLKETLSDLVELRKSDFNKLSECEEVELNIDTLRKKTQSVYSSLVKSRTHLCLAQEEFVKKKLKYQELIDSINELKLQIASMNKEIVDARSMALILKETVHIHQKRLLTQLVRHIFDLKCNESGVYTICGVQMTPPEKVVENNEECFACLGYVAHFLTLFSCIMFIPLCFPVSNRGSRSVIYDYLLEDLRDDEREFPLFLKTKEDPYFNYGVLILHKDIVHLRKTFGLKRRHSSKLLKSLYELIQCICQDSYIKRNNSSSTSSQTLSANEDAIFGKLKDEELKQSLPIIPKKSNNIS